MRVTEVTPQRIRLRGKPGGTLWMSFAALLGLTFMAASVFFAWGAVVVSKSYWPLLPLGFGFLMGILFTAIGLSSLCFGRLALTLDRVTGLGSYEVRSPMIDAGKPCEFELSQIKSVTVTKSESSDAQQPASPLENPKRRRPAKFCVATLRLAPRRRKILLDETQNGREQRVVAVATAVADWLQMPIDEKIENI